MTALGQASQHRRGPPELFSQTAPGYSTGMIGGWKRFNLGLTAAIATALVTASILPTGAAAQADASEQRPSGVDATIPLPVPRDQRADDPAPSGTSVEAAAVPSSPPLPPIRPRTPSGVVADAFAPFGRQAPIAPAQQARPGSLAYAAPQAPLPIEATPLGTLLSGPAAADPDCRALAAEGTAVFTPKPAFGRASGCGASAPIELKAVRRRDGGLVTFQPAAVMRCSMARAASAYVRDDLVPAAASGGMTLDQIDVAASYDCRGRNRVPGARLSEHGRANALDIRGFGFSNGRDHGVYSKSLPARLRAVLMPAACERFNTVLGPGSDGHHEDHLHVDLQERRRAGSKTCRWRGA